MNDAVPPSFPKKVGRRKTKRQAQIHPKVRQEIAEEFGKFAMENDMSQGQFFEKVWNFFKEKNKESK